MALTAAGLSQCALMLNTCTGLAEDGWRMDLCDSTTVAATASPVEYTRSGAALTMDATKTFTLTDGEIVDNLKVYSEVGSKLVATLGITSPITYADGGRFALTTFSITFT